MHDDPAQLLEPLGALPVPDAHTRLRHIGGVVGEDGDEHLARKVRVAHDERDVGSTGHPVVEVDGEAQAPQALRQIQNQAIRLGSGRRRPAPVEAVGHARPPCRQLEEIREEVSARGSQTVPVEHVRREAADDGQPLAGGSQRLEEPSLTARLAQGTEPVEHPAVRRAAEPDGEDDRLAGQPLAGPHLRDDERLGLVGTEERSQGGVVPHLGHDGLPHAFPVHHGRRDNREGLLGAGEGVLDDELDDVVDLRRRALDRAVRGRHPGAFDGVQPQEGGGGRQRCGGEPSLVAVLGEEGGEIRIAAGGVGVQRDRGQDGGEARQCRPGRAARVADDENLPPPCQRAHDDLEWQVPGGVEDDEVLRAARRDEVRYEHRGGHQARPQRTRHQRVALGALTQACEALFDDLREQGLALLRVAPQPTSQCFAGGGAGQHRPVLEVTPVEGAELGHQASEGDTVVTGERGVLSQHLLEHGAPPGQLELDGHHGRRDPSIGQVRQQATEALPVQAPHQGCPLRQRLEGRAVLVQPPEPVRELGPGEVGQVAAGGRRRQHLGQRVELIVDLAVLGLDTCHAVGYPRPATRRAVRLPHVALGLDLDQSAVEVLDRTTGPQHVLGLLAQAAAHDLAHLDAVLGAPGPCRRRGDQVRRRSLEHHRTEDVEGGSDA